MSKEMSDEQELFFTELRRIQDKAIAWRLDQQDKYDNIEGMLEDITYDILWMVCDLIDGYENELIKYRINNSKSNQILNDDISLHDCCEGFLRCTDVP